ncbi:hypothetical protein CcCBS67573_g05106 [Chytriomyces confervae]|uniref:Basal body-orientation factor 1 n=1 Tax=Chytriomyces confervae TaxID=246404 RepID=A0A507FDH4_9FUNG|nr:hypothetical protein HDU80_010223 [Chytriomyces hyalinus]TPX73630.1 hypothetical protein CcCBS67573_g05106 [Chytriomyces confervae]
MGEKKKKDKKDKKDKKKKEHGEKKEKKEKEMVLNARGEYVTAAQYAVELSLDATNKSLVSYKERMTGLISTNENLQETCTQQEKDALDVIAALHAESDRKESQIKSIRDEMEAAMERARMERQTIIEEAERKIQDMNSVLNEKDAAFKVMQSEFAVIKDFRKKRQDMLKELEYQKDELADTQRQHKETITRMERKFFEEKIRLQKEANRKISELAAKAHKEAVVNLNETTKEIYKENIRMAESLRYHVQEGEELAKQNKVLQLANRQLMEEKDLHNVIVKEKVLQVKQQAQEIKDLNTKIESMEHSLSHVVREFEHEREIIGKLARKELNEVRKVASRLKENLNVKTYEMKHIKRLAQHVLDQRTKLEKFFMDALDTVRNEIQKERQDAKKAAHTDYNRKIREVMSKKSAPFPPVQSFRAKDIPTNNQFNLNAATAVVSNIMKPPPSPTTKVTAAAAESSISEAANTQSTTAAVDIHDLSWQDKERVLRLLFAKMNGIALGVEESEEVEDPQDYQHDFPYDEQLYDAQLQGGSGLPGLGVIPDIPNASNADAQSLSNSAPPPPLEQFMAQKSDLQVTELGDADNEDGRSETREVQEEDTSTQLTTAYSGSRRNLLPKSENALPPIISGVTPRTDVSRAPSVTSTH